LKLNKTKIFKILLTILVLALIVAAVIYLFPIMKNLATPEGRIDFKQKVEEWKFFGFLAIFGLQVAQIFLFIVPGEPIEILAGMCYGGILGTIFILVSAFAISAGIFFMVRKFGKKFVYSFCDKTKVQKIENSKLFQNPKKIERIMLILFLLPGTPKDLLIYIARIIASKTFKIYSNINSCKNSISNIFNTCRCKYCRR